MKSWIAESDFSYRVARVPQPPALLQALVGENQNVRTAPSPSKPEDCHRFSTFITSLDKVLTEIENGFGGNDQDVLCALGDITLSDSPTSDSFDLPLSGTITSTRSYSRQTNACSVNSIQHTCSNH